jgi:hypothetical protein
MKELEPMCSELLAQCCSIVPSHFHLFGHIKDDFQGRFTNDQKVIEEVMMWLHKTKEFYQ